MPDRRGFTRTTVAGLTCEKPSARRRRAVRTGAALIGGIGLAAAAAIVAAVSARSHSTDALPAPSSTDVQQVITRMRTALVGAMPAGYDISDDDQQIEPADSTERLTKVGFSFIAGLDGTVRRLHVEIVRKGRAALADMNCVAAPTAPDERDYESCQLLPGTRMLVMTSRSGTTTTLRVYNGHGINDVTVTDEPMTNAEDPYRVVFTGAPIFTTSQLARIADVEALQL